MKPQFKCGYQGVSSYLWNGGEYSVRSSSLPYKGGHWNYTPEEYVSQVEATVGCVWRSNGSGEYPPPELVEHFPGYTAARFVIDEPWKGHWEYADGIRPEVVPAAWGGLLSVPWAEELAGYEREQQERRAAGAAG